MPLSHHDARPDVSIVIPVFNKLELTRVCIDSIYEHDAQASFEIILVDNGSTDGTRQWLQEQAAAGRLKAILNDQNLGFSRGCNVGAEASCGRYILFLNNDMEVTPHWLDPMVTILDNDAAVGITGAKLLFPDNTIQHAGVALVQYEDPRMENLSGVHIAYQKPSTSPGANQARYVQIVTGAALLVRQEIFWDLKGLSTEFWNGNEDVDLCLRAGEAGWKVVYQPESVIIHYESQSGPERWTQVKENVRLLNKKWFGRAKADMFNATGEEDLQPTSHNQIRSYTERRISRNIPATDAKNTVSVIVLTWNALEYTKLCAASLLEHTDQRHELIFVDNGSRPDTVQYLQDLGRQHNRIKVIFNKKNLGFAAGNNIGIAAASGRHICLLNSDTVVTEGWLENMLAHLDSDPRIGMVGPLTNSITGGQKLEKVDYDEDSCEGLAAFAKKTTAALAGKNMETMWVVGFAVLIRDELIERLGGLDETFGQGNYEDTDYCLRAFVGGYASVIAADSFVHHFGSRSFVAGKVDYAEELRLKHEIFRNKWNLNTTKGGDDSLNLAAMSFLGFVPALHFQPLPEVSTIPLWDWEKDKWINQGEGFFQANRLDEAQRVFRQILQFNPENTRAANNLACTLWRIGDPVTGIAEAITILEKVLEQDPDNEDAKWNLQEMSPAMAGQ